MRYLLDTNVVSERMRLRPQPGVVAWLDDVDEDRVFLSAVTVAEIRRGIALREPGRRRERLEQWLRHDLAQRFEKRLLAIDWVIADAWGNLMGDARRRGISLSAMDGFMAATALVHRLTLATRNVRDFEAFGVELFDPWQASTAQ